MSVRDDKMTETAEQEDRKSAVRALRRARRNLRNPESKLAVILMAYQNAQAAGTVKWVLPEV